MRFPAPWVVVFFFFLSNKPGWGGFARDALAKRLVLQRSKFQLLNVTFDGLHAAPSSRLWQKHEPQFRAKKPRKADLIFRQTIPEGVRSNFGIPKNAEVWLFGWGNYWPATSAAKIRRRRRGVKKKNQTGGKKKSSIIQNCIWSLISSPINEKILAPTLKFYSLLINIMWNFRWIS